MYSLHCAQLQHSNELELKTLQFLLSFSILTCDSCFVFASPGPVLLLASVVLDKVLLLVDLRLETHDTILLSDSNLFRIRFTRDRHLMIQVTQ